MLETILIDNFSGGVETARIKVIWDYNDTNVMADRKSVV